MSYADTADTSDEPRTAAITARAGRDAGKIFQIHEVPPLDFATFVLRLLSALRVASVDNLLALMRPDADAPDDKAPDDKVPDDKAPDDKALRAILAVLAGCDALAVRALITDALAYVQVAPDPRHPGMFRPLAATDIKEMATLGQVLTAFARLNFTPTD